MKEENMQNLEPDFHKYVDRQEKKYFKRTSTSAAIRSQSATARDSPRRLSDMSTHLRWVQRTSNGASEPSCACVSAHRVSATDSIVDHCREASSVKR